MLKAKLDDNSLLVSAAPVVGLKPIIFTDFTRLERFVITFGIDFVMSMASMFILVK